MANGDESRTGSSGRYFTGITDPSLYQLRSNRSSASVFENVEMAQDELFSGPVAESLPSSVSAFSHRRGRAESITSFTYYEELNYDANSIDRRASMQQSLADDFSEGYAADPQNIAVLEDDENSVDDEFLFSNHDYVLHRCSSTHSRNSVHARLIRRGSNVTTASTPLSSRTSQTVYMENEDVTIAIAGFRTTSARYSAYIGLCVLSCGILFLLCHWLPRLYIAILGRQCSLRTCSWVVVENQWGELAIIQIKSQVYGRSLSSLFGPSEKVFSSGVDGDNDPLIEDLRCLDYRHIRLCFHPVEDKFVLLSGWRDPDWNDVRIVRLGLDNDGKGARKTIFGSNIIDIEQKSLGQLLVDEVLHPFYIFQIASLVLWSLDTYYYYAVCIFFMSAGSISTTLIETRSTMHRLREISRFECDVRVLRNGFWKYVSSSDLVPGDVYELSDPNLAQFPSDSLLLTGDCIVNESMLTGESVPVSKLPATDATLKLMDLAAPTVSPEIARHFLFCGTKIVRARRPHEGIGGDAAALALVVRTGFNTTKGALVRSMLFPRPSGFKFYRDSFRYISVMAVIAIFGFIASFFNFVRLQLEWHLIIVRALDLITIVVPPALPATLTIGTNFALARLKKKHIFCISPQRVNVGGKLDLMCFDKTGTLTEEGLDILGLRVVSADTNKFGEVISQPGSFERGVFGIGIEKSLQAAFYTMATCHSLRSVDGELVGDPLDLRMFEFTGWLFRESGYGLTRDNEDESGGLAPSIAYPPNESIQLGIIKSFEFISQLRRASVIVRHFGQKSGDIFVKGAPEAMREICRPQSFPEDYDELLSYYTHKGYRVIGCATRHLDRLTWVRAQKMSRDEVEMDLDFVGFIIFENKLKSSTAGVLRELRESNIGAVMVTGDNILTAISVARECGLIDCNAHCYIPRFIQGNSRVPTAELEWENIDNSLYRLDKLTLLPLPAPPESDASLPYDISNMQNYSLAISGDVFRWIVDYATPETLQKVLVKGKVFARMSPDEKHELVEKLQSIDYCCGFCGDGANDCGALKAADVGISLSEAEASVAAPFTSRIFDIRCVIEVIREGRAALVTSFSCFKFMSLYSAIQFTTVSFLYASGSNLGDFQFLFIDLFLILPIAIFMGWAGPAEKLCCKRPTVDLVSHKVLVPLLGLMVISIGVQTVVYLTVKEQPWYVPPELNPDESSIRSSENTALFLVSCFEYVFSGIILNAGPPFRYPALQNWPFVSTIMLTLVTIGYMVLRPAHWLRKLMQLSEISVDYELLLVILGLLYLALAWIYEKHIALRLARLLARIDTCLTGRVKKRKGYKIIDEYLRK